MESKDELHSSSSQAAVKWKFYQVNQPGMIRNTLQIVKFFGVRVFWNYFSIFKQLLRGDCWVHLYNLVIECLYLVNCDDFFWHYFGSVEVINQYFPRSDIYFTYCVCYSCQVQVKCRRLNFRFDSITENENTVVWENSFWSDMGFFLYLCVYLFMPEIFRHIRKGST